MTKVSLDERATMVEFGPKLDFWAMDTYKSKCAATLKSVTLCAHQVSRA